MKESSMPRIAVKNPISSLDLTALDVRKISEPVSKVVAPVAKVARDGAYVAVGVGVIAAQKLSARRYDLRQRMTDVQQRVNTMVPRVRDEAQATAERVLGEATEKIRTVVERRKNVATDAATGAANTDANA
jgi:phosphoribosylcarboxyaminoimidazole (NCAIR) mutase